MATFLTRVLTRRFAWVPFALLLLYAIGVQLWFYRWDLGQWDVLQLSGWATLVVGLVAAQTVPARLKQTLERVTDRGVLVVPNGDLRPVRDALDAHSQRWATNIGAITAAVIFVAFVIARPGGLRAFGLLLPFEMVGGFVAGFHLGRLASFGRLGTILERSNGTIHPCPGHIDQAAGLKPIGDFFFFQAMIAGIPAAFLATWWALIPLKGARYAYWRRPYLALLAPAIVLEILAFLVPMLSFHKSMAAQKHEFLREADKLSIAITQLAATPAGKEQLAASTDRYQALEGMPTWPIDARTRRKFRINNLALLIPLIGQALGNTELGKQIADLLKNLTSPS